MLSAFNILQLGTWNQQFFKSHEQTHEYCSLSTLYFIMDRRHDIRGLN